MTSTPPPGLGPTPSSLLGSRLAALVRCVSEISLARCRPAHGLGRAEDSFEIFLAIEAVAVHRMAAGGQLTGAVPVAQGRRRGPEVGRRLLDGQVPI